MKNVLIGALVGASVFAMLFWTAARKTVHAAVLTAPPEGRFQVVQLHPYQGNTWSGILDTETGCVWVYASQTPPTDADVDAAPEGDQRDSKAYLQGLGDNYFGAVPYQANASNMRLPGTQQPHAIGEAELDTLIAEQVYCDDARQSALRAAAER